MKHIFVTVLGIMMLFAGCARVQVSQDYNTAANFTSYKSYGWKNIQVQNTTDIRVNNPLLHERFHRDIDQILTGKGFTQGTKADLLVTYNYSITSRIESDQYGTDVGFGFGRRSHYGGVTFGSVNDIRQYDVGILVIDIYDAAGNTLLWRGTGSEIITIHSTPEAITDSVNRMVGEILAQFPPQ
jgi:hypothetical protein